MIKHERTHNDHEPFSCDNCNKSFCSCDEIENQVSPPEKRKSQIFGCVICDKKFDKFNELRKHKKCHSDKPFNCARCNKKFCDFGTFLKHEEIHALETRGQCEKKSESEEPLKVVVVHQDRLWLHFWRTHQPRLCGQSK